MFGLISRFTLKQLKSAFCLFATNLELMEMMDGSLILGNKKCHIEFVAARSLDVTKVTESLRWRKRASLAFRKGIRCIKQDISLTFGLMYLQ